jgi:DNA polymerase III epsilon subunit-like protein
MTRLCFLDTETTGLDQDRHEVYEIGLVVRDPGGPELEWRWWLPVRLDQADPMALKVGQFFERRPPQSRTWSDALQWAPDKPGVCEQAEVREVAASVMELTAGAHLVGAVPSFDAAFLEPLLRANGCCPAWHYHLVCVEALAAGYLAGKAKADHLLGEVADEGVDLARPPWESSKLSAAVGVEPDGFDRHTALGDARWARAIYDAVIGEGRQP